MGFDIQKMTRREALAALGMMALATRTSFGATEATAPKGGGIALQLYTMRDPAKKDLVGTLKKCREMGWEYVQWSGMPNLPAEKIREALEAADLKIVACHVPMEPFEKDFEKEVKFWKTVGCKDIAPGGMMNENKKDLQAWLKGCERLEAIGAKLKEAGMRLSYHNHDWELQKFEGDPRTKLDILMETTKNVNMELDVAWAFVAGVDPAAYLLKYKGRCPVIHIKDMAVDGKKRQFKPLGQGQVPLKEVIKAGREAGVEWFVYEQDAGEGSPFGYVQASYDWLKKNF